MLQFDGMRYRIWLKLKDKFDYAEFVHECSEFGAPLMTIQEFSHKVGVLESATRLYPDLPQLEAYAKVFAEHTELAVSNRKHSMVVDGVVVRNDFAPSDPTIGVSSDGHSVLPVGPSRGLGDTVAKVTHATGISKLAEIYTKVTGRSCGCATRQEYLNKLVPYGIVEADDESDGSAGSQD